MRSIRHANDLDYISVNEVALQTESIKISMDNEKAGTKLQELCLDPRNYFYYCGAKFVNLQVVKEMKEIRNEIKDQRDILLIREIQQPKVK